MRKRLTAKPLAGLLLGIVGVAVLAGVETLSLPAELGNLIDRLWHGYVIDFADFFIGDWHYPAFNIADSGICIGAGLLILDSLLAGRRAKES